MKPLDLSKPYRTRDGRPVEDLCFCYDGSTLPLEGYVDGTLAFWSEDGRYCLLPHPMDLMEDV